MSSRINDQSQGHMGWKVLPVKVRFDSFTSDTFAMQNDGWQISQQWHPDRQAMTMAFKSPRLRLYMSSHWMEDFNPGGRYGAGREEWIREMGINIAMVSTEIEVMRMNVQEGSVSYFDKFNPVDATPRMFSNVCEKISDFNIFEPIDKSVQSDIIIKPESVPELMDRILNLQEPNMKRILEKERNRKFVGGDLGEIPHEVKTHAKIISIAS